MSFQKVKPLKNQNEKKIAGFPQAENSSTKRWRFCDVSIHVRRQNLWHHLYPLPTHPSPQRPAREHEYKQYTPRAQPRKNMVLG